MKHLLFIVACVEYLIHDAQVMVVVLGGLGQLRSDIGFLVLIESQVCCVCGFQQLREQILHDEHEVEIHTRDAARALSLNLQLGQTALEVFHEKHVVFHLEVRRPHVRPVCRNTPLLTCVTSTTDESTSFV
jgi:hypothetical protein